MSKLLRQRSWFRFNLAAMLLAVVPVAVVLGWVHDARHDRAVAARVLQSNPSAVLTHDSQGSLFGDYFARVTEAELSYPTDKDLELVARLPHLRRLFLGRAVDVTDAGLEQLVKLGRLELLVLDDDDQVSDAGLRTLGRLKSLARLELDRGRRMTPAGIERLKRALPKCRIEIVEDRQEEVLARTTRRSH
jgi:hypothetical protein